MSQSGNKLLAALPAREYQRLRPLMRTLYLPAEAALPHCGQTRVYFPLTGLCSIIDKMADGAGIEVACIGSEGVVGFQRSPTKPRPTATASCRLPTAPCSTCRSCCSNGR